MAALDTDEIQGVLLPSQSDGIRLTMQCRSRSCRASYRIQRVGPIVRTGAPKYCPLCGLETIAENNIMQSYWENMAEHRKLPLSLMLQLYSIWDSVKWPSFM